MIARLTRLPITHPWLLIAGCLVLFAVSAWGVIHLRYVADYKVFFSPRNPELQTFNELEETYGSMDMVLLAVEARGEGDLFTPERLAALHRAEQQLEETPHLQRIDSISRFPYSDAAAGVLEMGQLVPWGPNLTREKAETLKRRALAEPLVRNMMLSPDGSVTGFFIILDLPKKNDLVEIPEVAQHVRVVADELERAGVELTTHLAGPLMYNATLFDVAKRDALRLFPLASLLTLLMLFIFLRDLWDSLFALALVVFTVGSTMGVAGWLGLPMTPVGIFIPLAVLALTVAHAIHIQDSILRQLHAGLGQRDAVRAALRINLRPVFLTSATTAVGFLGLLFSYSPPYQHLGLMTSIGIAYAWFFSMTLLPALNCLAPLKPGHRSPFLHRPLLVLSEWIVARHSGIGIAFGAVIVIAVVLTPLNRIDDNLVHFFPHGVEVRDSTEFIDENLTGVYQLAYSLKSRSGSVFDPAYLREVDAFADWYATQDHVSYVRNIADVIRHLDLQGEDALPHDSADAQQRLMLYQMAMPDSSYLTDLVTTDRSATRFTVMLRTSATTEQMIDLEDNAQAWLQANSRHIETRRGTSVSMAFSRIMSNNSLSMLFATIGALVGISAFLIFALGSLRIGIISVIPNVAPILAALGLWGLLDGRIGMAVSGAACICLGIVVDDTIHMLSKYLHYRDDEHLSPEEGMRKTIATVGPAITATTLVLVATFLVITLSQFLPNIRFGFAISLAIALALICNLLLLPGLVLRFGGNNRA